MRRRVLAALAAVVLVGGAGLVLSRTRRPAPGGGPVVIFLVDTLRFDRMSAYGAARPTSPAARALALEGVRYDFAYSSSSWTRPAVASLFTSRWPAEVGVSGRGGAVSPAASTVAELLQRKGWRTAGFCANYLVSDVSFGFRRGFGFFQPVLSIPEEDWGIPVARRVVQPAIAWVRAQRDPRFFLYVHVMDPHSDWGTQGNPYRHWSPGYEKLFPTNRPAAASDREWSLSRYDALIRQADDQFAALRQTLEEKGWWHSALVAYLADHGEEFFEHGATNHGETLFEEVVRIPLIVKAPGWGKPGDVVRSTVTLLDLLPSIAAWVGLPSERGWRGRRLDRRDPEESGGTVYLSNELDRSRLYALRAGSKKVIASLTPPFRVEFDLEKDPSEQKPVPVEAALAERLERLRRSESSWLGGLRIQKVRRVPFALQGFVEVPGGGMPYLSLSDRDHFPVARSDPDRLPIALSVGRDESFEAHFLTLDGEAVPRPRLRVSTGGAWIPLETAGNGALLEVADRPRSTLTPQQLSEAVARMRALGYLGGD